MIGAGIRPMTMGHQVGGSSVTAPEGFTISGTSTDIDGHWGRDYSGPVGEQHGRAYYAHDANPNTSRYDPGSSGWVIFQNASPFENWIEVSEEFIIPDGAWADLGDGGSSAPTITYD